MTEEQLKIFGEGRAIGLQEAADLVHEDRFTHEDWNRGQAVENEIRSLSSAPALRYLVAERQRGQEEGRAEVAQHAQQLFQDMAREEDRTVLLETWALIRAGGFVPVPVAGLRTLLGWMNDAFQREGLRRPSQAAEARRLLQGWLEGKF